MLVGTVSRAASDAPGTCSVRGNARAYGCGGCGSARTIGGGGTGADFLLRPVGNSPQQIVEVPRCYRSYITKGKGRRMAIKRWLAVAVVGAGLVLGLVGSAQAATAPAETPPVSRTVSAPLAWEYAGNWLPQACDQRGRMYVQWGYARAYRCIAAPYGTADLWLLR